MSNDELGDRDVVILALEHSFHMQYHRDKMNAAVHIGETRYSPITFELALAIDLWHARQGEVPSTEMRPMILEVMESPMSHG